MHAIGRMAVPLAHCPKGMLLVVSKKTGTGTLQGQKLSLNRESFLGLLWKVEVQIAATRFTAAFNHFLGLNRGT